MKKIGLIAGSLRQKSLARQLARNLGSLLPGELLPVWVSIDDLPLYSDHLNDQAQRACGDFLTQIAGLDGFCLVTPEINHEMPGCLKNALDIASATKQGNLWLGKPAIIASVSTGPMGGISASASVKQVALTVGLRVIQPSELYFGDFPNLLAPSGLLRADQETLSLLELAVTHLATAVGVQHPLNFHLTDRQLTLVRGEKEVGTADLTIKGNLLTIKRILIPKASRGQGIAAQAMVRLLVIAQLFSWAIVPECAYAQWFFDHHVAAQRLLAQND
ncbi:hypothetical protein DA798_03065 [Lactobacillus sp. PFC-70]|nr:hypothetical protein DA798_03065 [Lactobacillus sp. PFC-70]